MVGSPMSSDMPILGIETSCDETSAAIVLGRKVLSNIVSSQVRLHAEYGGVVPELASREHIKAIIPIIELSLREANIGLRDIEGVAVTKGPGLVGSLLVGIQVAKAIAYSIGKPFVGVNHLEGHILSPFLQFELEEEVTPPEFPFICLLVSGGHTMLIKVDDFGKYTLLGSTRDDAAGECYDKVAKLLGLGYPGGPIIDKLAKEGDETAIKFPQALRRKDTLDFSFSGLKTAVALYVKDQKILSEEHIRDICASFQKSVIDILLYKTCLAIERYKIKRVVITGGVSANRGLREEAKRLAEERGFTLYLPDFRGCTDNGAMIGYVGSIYLKRGMRDGLELGAMPNLSI